MAGTLEFLRSRAVRASWADRSTMLLDGIVFARLTVRCATGRAEADFVAWRSAGRPADSLPGRRMLLGDCLRTLTEAVALCADGAMVRRLWTESGGPVGVAERTLADALFGVGIPKSHFALACAGFGRGGCIDSRLGSKHRPLLESLGVRYRPNGTIGWGCAAPQWALYSRCLTALWDAKDSAVGQWSEWLADLMAEGRPTQHSVLLWR
jgi:hypothetical protein